VEELRDRPQELVAYIFQGDPQAGTERISSCQERHGANRHDGWGSPWSNRQSISPALPHVWLFSASCAGCWLVGDCQCVWRKRHGRSPARPSP